MTRACDPEAPPVIILEGCNGVGKSTYALALAEMLSLPVIRPFRHGATDKHWGLNATEREAELKAAKVPFNTHAEDMYIADCLAGLGAGAILDRSVPSSIAYGIVEGQDGGWYNETGVPSTLMALWQKLLGGVPGPVLYVWLRAPHEEAKKRLQAQKRPWVMKDKQERLERIFAHLFQAEVRLPKRQINTADFSSAEGAASILHTLGNANS